MPFTCGICGKTHTFSREHFYVISNPIVICNRCAELIWESYMEVIKTDREAKADFRKHMDEYLETVAIGEDEKLFIKKIVEAFCTDDMDDMHSSEIRSIIDSMFWDKTTKVPMLKQWITHGDFSKEERMYFSKWIDEKDPKILEIMDMLDGINIVEGIDYEDGEFEDDEEYDEEDSPVETSNNPPVVSNVQRKSINIAEIIPEVLKSIKCQDDGVIQIGRLIYRHLVRLAYNNAHPEAKITDKQNFIVVGPTGVGKTATIREYCRLLGLPCVELDMTSITKAGYVGENIEDAFYELVSMANGDISLAEHGIVILDEGDKNSGGSDASGRDPGGRVVMIEMLKKLEGTNIPIGKNQTINTSDILFICLGTFEGAYEQRNQRLGGKKRLGFGDEGKNNNQNQIKRFVPEDLIKGGAPAEWVGRFPCIVEFKKLGLEDYITIMKESSKSIFLQTKKLLEFGYGGVELIMTPEGERRLAEMAVKYDVGVRGLNRIMAECLEEVEGNLIMQKGDYSKITIGKIVVYE